MDTLLNLRGPEFLRLYLSLVALATVTALLARWWFRRPVDDAWIEDAPLDPYEIAYLKGAEPLAVNAALASLVHCGALVVDPGSRRLVPTASPGTGAHELERAVHQAVERFNGNVKRLHEVSRDLTAKLSERLDEEGLICSRETARLVRLGSLIPFLAVLLLGSLKIMIGMQRDRPVSLLVMICVFTAALTLVFLVKRPHQTRRGSRLLRRLSLSSAALHQTAASMRGRTTLKPQDVALAVGLFGMGVMANGSLRDLKLLIQPPGTSSGSGCGGGCGGGGCGGGGCGGGCGGCGG